VTASDGKCRDQRLDELVQATHAQKAEHPGHKEDAVQADVYVM